MQSQEVSYVNTVVTMWVVEPRKIDVSVGKIYFLLPRQKGQVLLLHSQLWRKLQHLPVLQL